MGLSSSQAGSGPSITSGQYQLVWETASEAMALSDARGIVTAANPAYLRLYGFSSAEVVGQSFAIIFPPEVRAWAEAQYQQYFTSDVRPPPVEASIQRADGEHRIVESSVAFLEENGQRTAMLSIIRDITERKALEADLRASHERVVRAARRIERLQWVTAAFSQALTPHEVTRTLLAQGLPAIGAAAGMVMLVNGDRTALELAAHQGYDPAAAATWPRLPLEGDWPMSQAARSGQTLYFHTAAELHARYAPTNLEPPEHVAWAVLPLVVNDRVVGVLGLSFDAPQTFGDDERSFLQTLAGVGAQALERSRLYAAEHAARTGLERAVQTRTRDLERAKHGLELEMAERQQAEQALERSREEERTRLARELHDSLGGALTGLKMDLAQLRRLPPGDHAGREERLTALMALVDETVTVMRRISSDLRPPALDELGLSSAVEWLVMEFQRRSGLECRLALDADQLELDPDRAIAAFRIVQEALTNVGRHAEATLVEVGLGVEAGCLRLVVRDNGRGIDPERQANTQTLGLAGMRERVRLLRGELVIDSAPGRGTAVTVMIPIQP